MKQLREYELICKCTVVVGKVRKELTTTDKWCKECKTIHQVVVHNYIESQVQSDGWCDLKCTSLDGLNVCTQGGC